MAAQSSHRSWVRSMPLGAGVPGEDHRGGERHRQHRHHLGAAHEGGRDGVGDGQRHRREEPQHVRRELLAVDGAVGSEHQRQGERHGHGQQPARPTTRQRPLGQPAGRVEHEQQRQGDEQERADLGEEPVGEPAEGQDRPRVQAHHGIRLAQTVDGPEQAGAREQQTHHVPWAVGQDHRAAQPDHRADQPADHAALVHVDRALRVGGHRVEHHARDDDSDQEQHHDGRQQHRSRATNHLRRDRPGSGRATRVARHPAPHPASGPAWRPTARARTRGRRELRSSRQCANAAVPPSRVWCPERPGHFRDGRRDAAPCCPGHGAPQSSRQRHRPGADPTAPPSSPRRRTRCPSPRRPHRPGPTWPAAPHLTRRPRSPSAPTSATARCSPSAPSPGRA